MRDGSEVKQYIEDQGYDSVVVFEDPDTVVISSSHGKGYKLPASKEELIACRNEYRSREQEMHERVQVLDEAIRRWKDNKPEVQLTFGF